MNIDIQGSESEVLWSTPDLWPTPELDLFFRSLLLYVRDVSPPAAFQGAWYLSKVLLNLFVALAILFVAAFVSESILRRREGPKP